MDGNTDPVKSVNTVVPAQLKYNLDIHLQCSYHVKHVLHSHDDSDDKIIYELYCPKFVPMGSTSTLCPKHEKEEAKRTGPLSPRGVTSEPGVVLCPVSVEHTINGINKTRTCGNGSVKGSVLCKYHNDLSKRAALEAVKKAPIEIKPKSNKRHLPPKKSPRYGPAPYLDAVLKDPQPEKSRKGSFKRPKINPKSPRDGVDGITSTSRGATSECITRAEIQVPSETVKFGKTFVGGVESVGSDEGVEGVRDDVKKSPSWFDMLEDDPLYM
jgi:hypothetical protein